MSKLKSIAGVRFGRLTAMSRVLTGGRHTSWLCVCDCGAEITCLADNLKKGATQSCGCLNDERRRERKTHGHTQTKTYKTWSCMFTRCYNERDKSFRFYGAKGVRVCERWKSFENFLADMGERPDGMTLDRIDSAKWYGPDNCRWATIADQQRNRSDNVWCELNGARMVRAEVCRVLGIGYKAANKYRIANA